MKYRPAPLELVRSRVRTQVLDADRPITLQDRYGGRFRTVHSGPQGIPTVARATVKLLSNPDTPRVWRDARDHDKGWSTVWRSRLQRRSR